MRVSQRERKRESFYYFTTAIYEKSTTLMLQMLCFGKLPNCLSFDRRGERFLIINNFYKPSEPRYISLIHERYIRKSAPYLLYHFM